MRIVHLLTEPDGGGGVYAMALARAAHARGDSVAFASPRPLSDEFETVSLDLLRSRSSRRALTGADVIHCHGIRAGLAGLFPFQAAVVQTPNGVHQARSRHGAAGAAARAGTRAILRAADLVICVSQDEFNFVLRLVPRRKQRLRLVLNGVKPGPLPTSAERRVARKALGLEDEQPVLLFLGGLRFQKNPMLALEAVRLARAEVSDLVLLVAGTGPLLSDAVAAAGPEIRLLGHRADPDVLLAAADALLNTSRWEGLSLALLEALWRGRPLVVTDAAGNAEAAGDAGFVVGDGDPTAIADAIVSLFRTPGLLRDLSGRARHRAERLFDEARMAERTLAVYDEAIELKAR